MRDDAVLGHALPLDRGLGPAPESVKGNTVDRGYQATSSNYVNLKEIMKK